MWTNFYHLALSLSDDGSRFSPGAACGERVRRNTEQPRALGLAPASFPPQDAGACHSQRSQDCGMWVWPGVVVNKCITCVNCHFLEEFGSVKRRSKDDLVLQLYTLQYKKTTKTIMGGACDSLWSCRVPDTSFTAARLGSKPV